MAKIKKMKIKRVKKPSKATVIYIFLIPLFVSTIKELFANNYSLFLLKLIGFGLIFGSIKLIDKGLLNEFNYNNSNLALAPKIKYKLFGSIALTIALLFIVFTTSNLTLINGVFSAVLGGVGAYIYYGKDPSVDKLPKDKSANYKKIIESLNEAKEKLKKIENSNQNIEDKNLKSAIDKTLRKAHDILNTIEQDPKDISIVRKFMVVYLDGVKDVISKYNSIDKEVLDSSYKERLISLLDDATKRFDKELERLKSNDLFDLDVQIDALKEQLKH